MRNIIVKYDSSNSVIRTLIVGLGDLSRLKGERNFYLETIFLESNNKYQFSCLISFFKGHAEASLVEALCYKPEGRGFDSR
jgi:hypothetical protein